MTPYCDPLKMAGYRPLDAMIDVESVAQEARSGTKSVVMFIPPTGL